MTEASVGPRASGERRLGVLRGPCYLALRTLLAGQHGLDGLVLVAEPGRALNERDVADVTGLDVVATVPVTPGVARTIDAGLLAARHQNQREFRDLRRWLTTQLDPFPTRPPPRRATAPTHPEMAGTDLLGALCAPSGIREPRGEWSRVASRIELRPTPSSCVLNIGKLSPGAGEYYVGEIATSAEDYYTGRGEAQGGGSARSERCWVFTARSTASTSGVCCKVTTPSRVSTWCRRRARRVEPPPAAPGSGPTEISDEVDSARAAAFLGVSHQYVRRLLKAGTEYQQALDGARSPTRWSTSRAATSSASGALARAVTGSARGAFLAREVERLAAERDAAASLGRGMT